MKNFRYIIAIVAVSATLVTTSCKKEDPIIPLNALMGGTWVYEEKDNTDGGGMTHREMLTFTSETDCKRVNSYRTLLRNDSEEYDMTYTFDGEVGILTGIYFIYTKPSDLFFKYDSLNDKLTVWCYKDTTYPDTRRFVYFREK